MTSCVLIEHATVVTMNPQRDIMYDASIVIQNERIFALGNSDELSGEFPGADRIDARARWCCLA